MFGGREETLHLEFENHFIGVIIDHFGTEVMILKKDEEHFVTTVRVNVSPQFFGWLAGIGTGAEIISPESVRKEYTMFLNNALEKYKNN